MLTIRREQTEAFDAYMRRRFEDEMVKHLHEVLPEQAGEREEPELRDLVRQGVEKGAKHEINAERDVAKLIELMLEFGEDFETEEGREWAAELLEHPTLETHAKTELLADRMAGEGQEA